MSALFTEDILLATSPNAGGVTLIANGAATVLDQYDTTGLWITGDMLLRNVIFGTQTTKIMQLQAFSAAGKKVLITDEHYDFHDILIFENQIYLVSTGTNEVIVLDMGGHEVKRYEFPNRNDSWHINCLGVWNDRIVLSAFGEFDSCRGYKHNSQNRGFVIDLKSRQKLWVGLSQPHNPVQHGNKYFVCNSEEKQVLIKDDYSGMDCLQFDGYTRGIAFSDHFMYVGLSQSRNIVPGSSGKTSARIMVLDLATYKICGEISLPFAEIYDLRIIKSRSLLPIIMLSLNGAELKHGLETMRHELETIQKRSESLFTQFQRVNRHVIAGPFLRLLRWVKHDDTFGNPDVID